MAKAADLRAKTDDELSTRLGELKKAQFNMRFQKASGQLTNTAQVGETRKEIAQLKSVQAERRRDGLYLAVLQRATLLTDQTRPTVEAPASFERIARTADDARYQRRESSVVLWETHVLPAKLSPAVFRRALTVAE